MNDSLMAEILILQTTRFVMSNPRNFKFGGSIADAMLENVPPDNTIIRAYRKFPSSGVRPIPTELQKIIDEGNKPSRGGKRKAKATTSESVEVPKRAKKPIWKPRSPYLAIQEESGDRTVTEVQEETHSEIKRKI